MHNYGRYVINDLEFEKELSQMNTDDKLNFIARLSYSNSIRISSLEAGNKKTLGIIGGAGGILGVAIASIIDYILRR